MHPEILYKHYKKAHYDMKTPNAGAFWSSASFRTNNPSCVTLNLTKI